ncbi:ABC transporter ATP-binding protein [Candidatus Bathyarchaeota archaeon]|nr:ABC transporter ATP-binding protein [Candidatus Bathyarchaeota archaeon]
MNRKPLLSLENLKVYYYTDEGVVKAVDSVSFNMDRGETVGLVGESGSGKSTLGLSILRLIPPPGKIVGGKVFFDGIDLTALSEDEMRKVRGKRIGMVFQDPMTSLNPLMKVGDHIVETIVSHEGVPREKAVERACSLLEDVGILPERFNDYPHQLSGGMRQRIMIALALCLKPDLVIADEPTSALDVIVQYQILELMRKLKQVYGMGLILITHDVSIVAEVADRIAIMYAGQLVEYSDVNSFFNSPLHPYSEALLESIPNIQLSDQKLKYIPGIPPSLINPPKGCRFHVRCPYAEHRCGEVEPQTVEFERGRFVKCFRYVE